MTKAEMIDLLNNIIKHERKHFNFYMHAFLMVKGLERAYLAPVFEKEMRSELEHVIEFSEKVVALGGVPESGCFNIPIDIKSTTIELCRTAIAIEREVLKVYHEAYPLAEEYAAEHLDMSIALLLEENIEHTTKDVEELEKLFSN
jgi:bacterioferritin (cytochrome b1)